MKDGVQATRSDQRLAIGVIGLGKMGLKVAQQMHETGWLTVGYDAWPEARKAAATNVADLPLANSLTQLFELLPASRLFWLMVPAGAPVDEVLAGLQPSLKPGDIVVDAGNSFYRDSQRRATLLAASGVHYLDSGSSGGVEGAAHGLCLMIGGTEEAFHLAEPLFTSLAAPGGCAYVGPSGAGHFVKMVHNAIEYGMLEAIGEGFELLEKGPFPALDLRQISALWNRGSVIRGWLMELAARAFRRDPELAAIRGVVGGGATGSWAIEEAWKAGVPLPAIAISYAMRHRSRQDDSFAAKLVAALRHEFGGHETIANLASPVAGGETRVPRNGSD